MLAYNPAVPATSQKTSPDSRAGADRCPGALRLAEAADGYLARVRLPGGFVTGEQLRVLAGLATELGDGRIELTSRGNVQLRALAMDAAEPLTAALARAGLLPSLAHDRVRNVLASPLAGLDGPRAQPVIEGGDDPGQVPPAAGAARPVESGQRRGEHVAHSIMGKRWQQPRHHCCCRPRGGRRCQPARGQRATDRRLDLSEPRGRQQQ
jgi:hypothetical protein